MLDLEKRSDNQEDTLVSLESLAQLTGFPVEMIKRELFSEKMGDEQISLAELRTAMSAYIDATMLK